MLFVSKIDEVFSEAFKGLGSEFKWSSFVILLTGILIGFVVSVAVYLIVFLISIKNEKKIQILKANINEIQEKTEEEIKEIKDNFLNDSDGLPMKEKTQLLGSTIYKVVNTVAMSYYPESKYPLYELSVEELIMFLHYLSNRLDEVFSKGILKPFRKMTISQVFRFIDTKKRIDENKLVKAASKAKPGKVFGTISTVLNYANPIYWFKKAVINTTINLTMNKIFLLVIDIVADETNKAYSKSIFNQELQLNKQAIESVIQEIAEQEE